MKIRADIFLAKILIKSKNYSWKRLIISWFEHETLYYMCRLVQRSIV